PEAVVSANADRGDAEASVSIEARPGTEMRFYQETPSRHVLDIVPPDAGAFHDSVDLAALLARIEADPGLAAAQEPERVAAAETLGLPLEDDATEPDTDPLTPTVSTVGTTIRIVFPFETETAAAVFRRGEVVWMIFETPRPIRPPADGNLL